jgi:glutamyl-tRNA reductase
METGVLQEPFPICCWLEVTAVHNDFTVLHKHKAQTHLLEMTAVRNDFTVLHKHKAQTHLLEVTAAHNDFTVCPTKS